MRIPATLGIVMLFASSITASPQDAPVDHFEVASLRISQDRIRRWSVSEPGAREFTLENTNLLYLMSRAFGYGSVVSGEPKWFYTTSYTVRATAPEGRGLSDEELRLPIQHLLEERLHLRWHMQTNTVSGYALVVGKNGPKLTPNTGAKYRAIIMGGLDDDGLLIADNSSLEELAAFVGPQTGRTPLIDNTGLKGRYDVRLTFAGSNSTDSTKRPMLQTLREDLGLDIVKAKVEQKTIVIDHVDEIPEEN